MASIHKTDAGTYQVRWRDQGVQEAMNFKLMRDAKVWAEQVEVDMRQGTYVNPSHGKRFVTEQIVEMLDARVNVRPATLARDHSYFDNHIRPHFGNSYLDEVRPEHVQRWVRTMIVDGYSPATIRKAHELLAKVFAMAVERNKIKASPCLNTNLPKIETNEMRFLSVEEIESLANAMPNRYRAMVLVAGYTGMRWGEIAGLRNQRVDLDAKTIRVEETLSSVRGKVELRPYGKTKAARRTISLPDDIATELELHLKAFPSPKGFVFSSPAGAELRSENFRKRVWNPAVTDSVGQPLRFHDLRHSHAAVLIAENIHLKVIQQRLGHKSITTTLDVYGHLLEGLDEGAAQALNEKRRSVVHDLFTMDADKVVPITGRP